MDAYLLFDFLQALGNSHHCCHTRQGDEVSKGKKMRFYFNLRTDALGGNLNPSLRPNIQANGDRQSSFCWDILCLVQIWDRSSDRGGTQPH